MNYWVRVSGLACLLSVVSVVQLHAEPSLQTVEVFDKDGYVAAMSSATVKREQVMPREHDRLLEPEQPKFDLPFFQLVELGEQKDTGVHINFDGLDSKRSLNVSASVDRIQTGDTIYFKAHSNYQSWIVRGEIRLSKLQAETDTPFARLPLQYQSWTKPVAWVPDLPGEYRYVLRVYDKDGHYDETQPLRFSAGVPEAFISGKGKEEGQLNAGYGESRLAVRSIPLSGGKVRLYGTLPEGGKGLRLNGIEVPVDAQKRYVLHEIMPAGDHELTVDIEYIDGHHDIAKHRLQVPESEWFAVGLMDLTFGKESPSGPMAELTSDDQHYTDKAYGDGRISGYLRGRTAEGLKVVASVDTQDQPLESLFKGLNKRDPRTLLRHIQEKPAYATYGDDSHIEEDAPTQGKFYVRVEKNKTQALWGDFKTSLLDTELSQIDRTMFGAKLHMEPSYQTSQTEPPAQLDVFVAQPDTLPVRELFRGTGGSIYFLRHADVLQGAVQARVEVRAQNSQQVLYAKELLPGMDYDVDAMQGRILLNSPLPSVPDQALMPGMPSNVNHRNDEVYLVVRYEYVPSTIDLQDQEIGGRASVWLNEHVKVGTTADILQLADGSNGYALAAADITLRYQPSTFVKLEAAVSKGQLGNELVSLDGGFNANTLGQAGASSRKAKAGRIEVAARLQDFYPEEPDMRFAAYIQDRDAGYSAPGKQTLYAVKDWEARLELPLNHSETAYLRTRMGEWDEGVLQRKQWLGMEAMTDINRHWFAALDLYGERVTRPVAVSSAVAGEQVEATGKLGYRIGDDKEDFIYALARSSLRHTNSQPRTDAAGGGMQLRVSDKLKLSGEALLGSAQGKELHIAADYQYSDHSNVYVSYVNQAALTTLGQGGRNGNLVTGLRSRFDGGHSIYVEDHWMTGTQTGLKQVYGLDLTLTDAYSIGLGFEHGRLKGIDGQQVMHSAVSLSQRYQGQGWNMSLGLEARQDGSVLEQRKTGVARFTSVVHMNDDWRILSRADVSRSVSSQGATFAGDFTDASLAFAYRPVDDNRLNMLASYTYFENLPAAKQLTATGSSFDFRQRSHVVAVDGDLTLINGWRIGGKLAQRSGMLQDGRVGTEPWYKSTTKLAIARSEIHLVQKWDAVLEWRQLRVLEAKDERSGGVVGIYRHIGAFMKMGVGYNFTDFSDNLTDFSATSRGWFVNVMAKY